MNEQPESTIGLEAHIARLETIVSALERDELDLEAALTIFEEGVGRLRAAQEILRHAELRIERLLEDGEGGGVTEAMERD